jgi:hypothetical protein
MPKKKLNHAKTKSYKKVSQIILDVKFRGKIIFFVESSLFFNQYRENNLVTRSFRISFRTVLFQIQSF